MDAPLGPSSPDELHELKRKYNDLVAANDPKTRWQEMYEFLRSRTPQMAPHVLQGVLLTPHELRERYNPTQPSRPSKLMEYELQVLLRMELLDFMLKKQKERQDAATPAKKDASPRTPPTTTDVEKENEDAAVGQLERDALMLLEYLSIILDPEHCGIVQFLDAIVRYYMRAHPAIVKSFYEALELEKPAELGGSPKRKIAKDKKPRTPAPASPTRPDVPSPATVVASPKNSILLRSSSGSQAAGGFVRFHTTTVKRKRAAGDMGASDQSRKPGV